MVDFIQCDEGFVENQQGILFCRPQNGATFFTEQQIIDQYGVPEFPRMDQGDFLILGGFATMSFAIAYGVKILRNSFGDK